MFMLMLMTVVVLMAVFPNALFYTTSLLVISLSVLVWMVSSNLMSTLMFLLISIVYVGAMMIFIGYICAVSPNMVLVPNYNYIFLVGVFFFIYLLTYKTFVYSSSKMGSLLDYFFSSWGVLTFILIALMLFLTLLMVTSQYSSPQGPFRSIQ